MIHDRHYLDIILRQNLYFFVQKAFGTLHPGQAMIPAWHVQAICWKLQQVAEGQIRRLLITVPPRHLKSISTSVGFVAWLLGQDPALNVIVASYGQDLAGKHARDFRKLIDATWYARLFPDMKVKKKTESEIETTKGGGRQAVSLGGAVTGFQLVQELLEFQRLQHGFNEGGEIDEIITVKTNGPGLVDG